MYSTARPCFLAGKGRNDTFSSTPLPAWRGVACHAAATEINNLLLTRLGAALLLPHGRKLTLQIAGTAPAHFKPACVLPFTCGGHAWTAAFDSAAPLLRHPALRGVTADTLLPLPLRQALLELFMEPVGAFLQETLQLSFVLDDAVFMDDSTHGEAHQPPRTAFTLWAMLYIQEADEAKAAVLLRLSAEDDSAGHAVADALRRLPPRRCAVAGEEAALLPHCEGGGASAAVWPAVLAQCPLSVGLLAAAMRLNWRELRSLHIGDTLLPELAPFAHGQLLVHLPDGCVRRALWQGRTATLEDQPRQFFSTLFPPQDAPMSDMQDTDKMMAQEYAAASDPLAAVPENAADAARPTPPEMSEETPEDMPADTPIDAPVGDVAVTLTMELERRQLPLRDLTALVPGYVFVLDAAQDAPVTLRANGLRIGTGRLVDVNGVAGVQILSLG